MTWKGKVSLLSYGSDVCCQLHDQNRSPKAHSIEHVLKLNAGFAPDISPPRERKKQQNIDGRKFSWATQKIHDLEKELEQAKARIKVRACSHPIPNASAGHPARLSKPSSAASGLLAAAAAPHHAADATALTRRLGLVQHPPGSMYSIRLPGIQSRLYNK